MKALHTRVVLSYPCETCGVGPYNRCITTSNKKKNEFHTSRSRAASENGWRFADEDSTGRV